MSFTLHSVFFTLKVSILLGSLLGLCLGLEFMGLPNQWARYLRWDASTRGDLSFQFKTNVSTGLLLYLDDGGVCDFLCLSLVDGRIQLRFSMDCAETAVLSNKQVNDSSWHFLMVSRDRLRTVLLLDGEGQAGELQPQRPYMDVVSDLFLGGVPADIRPSALTLDGVQAMPGFKGLILDLKYGNSEPRLLGSQGVQLDAEGPCGERPCENGGICFLLDGHPTCDCSTTGYGGKLCSEEWKNEMWFLQPQDISFLQTMQRLIQEGCDNSSAKRKKISRIGSNQEEGKSDYKQGEKEKPMRMDKRIKIS
uniref:Neurexin 3 n=1 Tax=Callithrix jacchus TaxID=9483 RepID=A0A8I3WCR0_CALJA